MEELLVICRLVRMSVFETGEDIPTGVNWDRIFRMARNNGVSALCYEAVKRLPPASQPDSELLRRWKLSAQGIRGAFYYRHEVTRCLCDILERNGIRMLMLRGETLAENYPEPELRESGEVDFVALPSHKACHAYLEFLGVKVRSQRRQSSFVYKGVHFENYMLKPVECFNSVYRRTMALLRKSLSQAVQREDGCLMPEPVVQAIISIMHTALHSSRSGGRVSLRMLLDLELLLHNHPDIVDKWEPLLKEVGLYSFAQVMLCATCQLLGTDRIPRLANAWNCRTHHRANRLIKSLAQSKFSGDC